MPAQALYLKYRPRTFAEIEGQEHVTRTLTNALALNRISHAYLFTGPRGTGKTSTARILAKAVNCLSTQVDKPCNECAICRAINEERMLDLIEIDAASNTSVDDVRDLREKVDFRPGEAKFKVYIIDEVHMLSGAAFNALLKTLEEPPPHVIFVLATTDPQKIPATVISRVQRFDFRRLSIPEIIKRLEEIASYEQIKAEPAALELVARQATGAMRDAISLLDQLVSYGGDEITLAQAQGLLGTGARQSVTSLVCAMAAKDIAGGLVVIGQAVDDGADPRQLAREVVEYLRSLMLIQVGAGNALTISSDEHGEMSERAEQIPPSQILKGIRFFSQAAYELRSSASPTLPLEIALVETIKSVEPTVSVPTAHGEPEPGKQVAQSAASEKKKAVIPPKRALSKPEAAHASSGVETQVDGELTVGALRENWSRILARVRVYDKVAEALLRSAEPIKVDQNQITLGFPYELHMQRFEKEPKTKLMLEKALGDIFSNKSVVKCVLLPKKAKMKAAEEDPLIRAAVNQLGAEITDIHEGA